MGYRNPPHILPEQVKKMEYSGKIQELRPNIYPNRHLFQIFAKAQPDL